METNTLFMETSAISRRKIHQQQQSPHLLSTDSSIQIPKSPSRSQSSSLEIPYYSEGSERSHILLWLHTHPNQPHDYERDIKKNLASVKRKRKTSQSNLDHNTERLRLAELDLNNVSPSRRSTRTPTLHQKYQHATRDNTSPTRVDGPRPQLAPITGNIQLQEHTLAELDYRNLRNDLRKRRKILEDQGSQDMENEVPKANGRGHDRGRARGRSRGNGVGQASSTPHNQRTTRELVAEQKEIDLTPAGRSILAPPSTPSRLTSKEQSPSYLRPPSPSKRSKSAHKPKTDGRLDMSDLESCIPSVSLKSAQEAKELGPLPPNVESLYKKLKLRFGFIPEGLKSYYDSQGDTPRKSKEPPENAYYLPQDSTIFPPEFFHSLKTTVNQVLKTAALNRRLDAHERQWEGTTVNPLLNLVLQWQKAGDIILINVESCKIEPPQMRMTRQDGNPLDDDTTTATSTSATSNTITTDIGSPISRMIDWCLGLMLSDEHANTVNRAFKSLPVDQRTLNQSLSFIKKISLFVDLEIKKTNSHRTPEVQLAIWAAALLKKRKRHGWDTSMPMPGIVVKGDVWECYLFFEREENLIMMGAIPMGTTSTVHGIYEILYKLEMLVQWGTTEFRQWFVDTILQWCRKPGGEKEATEPSHGKA